MNQRAFLVQLIQSRSLGRRAKTASLSAIALSVIGIGGLSGISNQALACGGFFCQNVPVDQAGEQIVFRQQGSTISAMIRILYTGAAEEFSWVVPVPNTPDLAVGSDNLFDQLEGVTRPQFFLEQRGQGCFSNFDLAVSVPAAESAADSGGAQSAGVEVEERVVGPFDIQILSSDDPTELATWLANNDYDLTDRGAQLIEPYVLDGFKFVGVKLQSGVSSGSIQPLIMTYQNEKPMVPIRLTAVAAEDDMGILIWTVSDARAVPENYLHVIPNIGRINWFQGPFNAFASYQGLVTEAMDEAGGQGFATDYAGPVSSDITQSLGNADQFEEFLVQNDAVQDNASFIANVLNIVQPTQLGLDFLQALLPPPAGFDQFIYFDPIAMQVAFTGEQLAAARPAFREFVVERTIEPLRESLELIPEGAYMTRLFTTLSAEEMTLDPEFVYNSGMPEQATTREAVLDVNCTDAGNTEWQLTLGAGTGREGEVIAQGDTDVPFNPPPEVIIQPAMFRSETTAADALPVTVTSNVINAVTIGDVSTFPVPPVAQTPVVDEVINVASGGDDDDGFLGSAGVTLLALLASLLGRHVWRRRYKDLL